VIDEVEKLTALNIQSLNITAKALFWNQTRLWIQSAAILLVEAAKTDQFLNASWQGIF